MVHRTVRDFVRECSDGYVESMERRIRRGSCEGLKTCNWRGG